MQTLALCLPHTVRHLTHFLWYAWSYCAIKKITRYSSTLIFSFIPYEFPADYKHVSDTWVIKIFSQVSCEMFVVGTKTVPKDTLRPPAQNLRICRPTWQKEFPRWDEECISDGDPFRVFSNSYSTSATSSSPWTGTLRGGGGGLDYPGGSNGVI